MALQQKPLRLTSTELTRLSSFYSDGHLSICVDHPTPLFFLSSGQSLKGGPLSGLM